MTHWRRGFLPVAPMCQGCPHKATCAELKLACRQFEHWANHGGKSWRKCQQRPTHTIFQRVFPEAA